MRDDLRYGSDKTDTEKQDRLAYASGQHGRADDVNDPKTRIGIGFILDRPWFRFTTLYK